MLGPPRERFVAQPLIWRELLGASRFNGELAVLGSGDVKSPRSTAHVAVSNELPLFVRVYVDFDDLEAIRANDLGGIFHGATAYFESIRVYSHLHAMSFESTRGGSLRGLHVIFLLSISPERGIPARQMLQQCLSRTSSKCSKRSRAGHV